MDNGGSPITGYWLEKREVGGVYWSRVNRAPVTKPAVKGLEYNVLRLAEGVEYQFRVMAENLAGIGPPSEPSDPALAADPICKYIISTTILEDCTTPEPQYASIIYIVFSAINSVLYFC